MPASGAQSAFELSPQQTAPYACSAAGMACAQSTVSHPLFPVPPGSHPCRYIAQVPLPKLPTIEAVALKCVCTLHMVVTLAPRACDKSSPAMSTHASARRARVPPRALGNIRRPALLLVVFYQPPSPSHCLQITSYNPLTRMRLAVEGAHNRFVTLLNRSKRKKVLWDWSKKLCREWLESSAS